VLENRSIAVAAPLSSRARSVELPSRQRSRRTNRPVAAGNTAISRRVRDLTRAFLSAIGNPNDVALQAQAVAAAEMVAIAELMRERALEGGEVDLSELVRLQSCSERALRRLGIDQRQREPSDGLTLEKYLAQKRARAEAGA
jgi:hypothetical protein